MKASKIIYQDNLGYITLPNCKPRQVYINYIGKYFLKRCNKTKKQVEVYLND